MAQNDPVSRLIFELAKLPGIGEKSATRLAYFILKQDPAYAEALATSMLSARQAIRLCASCFTFTDTERCRICTDPSRTQESVCIVERPADLLSIEQTGRYKGLYHVLHGALSPLDGVGPEELKIHELLARLKGAPDTPAIREIILATNPSVEGEATSLYLSRLIRPLGIKVTQLAHGLPVGGLLEYADRQTIGKAFDNRMEVHG